jgi:hypothetical protein
MTRAGLPTATDPGGTGLGATDPAPIVDPCNLLTISAAGEVNSQTKRQRADRINRPGYYPLFPTSAITIAPAPVQQSAPIVTCSKTPRSEPVIRPSFERALGERQLVVGVRRLSPGSPGERAQNAAKHRYLSSTRPKSETRAIGNASSRDTACKARLKTCLNTRSYRSRVAADW